MARSGFSTSNFLRCSSAVVTGVPLTFSTWFNPSSFPGTSQRLFGLYHSTETTRDRNAFIVGLSATNPPVADVLTCDAFGFSGVVSSGPIGDIGVWTHIAGVFSSDSSRKVYTNGANIGTATTTVVPGSLDRTSIGLEDTAAPALPAFGAIGECAIWNIALSDTEVAMLAKGLSPLLMHPEALVAYWPLLGNNSPENNLKSNSATMSIVGSLTKVAHPRIFMPKRKKLIYA